MISIVLATKNDFKLLSDIGRQTFIESHGKSAPNADIAFYLDKKFTESALQDELADVNNIYHIIYYEDKPVGYSKIILNVEVSAVSSKNITKLERLYILEEFYDKKLGLELFNFNVALSKNNQQAGIWLFVWQENKRAINFYKKNGFEVIGTYDFKLSETHSNPNYQLFLAY